MALRFWSVGLASLALTLSACNTAPIPTAEPASRGGPNDLPFVPRAERPAAPVCDNSASASAGPLAKREFSMLIEPKALAKPLSTDLPDTVQALLFSTRSMLNKLYYGYSEIDIQALHKKYAAVFRKTYPGNFGEYPIATTDDETMSAYLREFEDGHTGYINAANYQAFRDVRSANQQPVPSFGAALALVPGGDGLLITDVRGDGPAFEAGIRRGDVILELDGQKLQRGADDDSTATAYIGILTEAAKKDRSVPVAYDRKGQARTSSIQAKILSAANLPWGEVVTDAKGSRVFYLRLPTFGASNVANRVHELVALAQGEGADGIIVDLRNNGGGLVIETIGAAAAFAPETSGLNIAYLDANDIKFKYDAGVIKVSDSCGNSGELPLTKPTVWNGKTVVLVNGGSASGAEIFPQNLREGKKAFVIGEETVGVGDTSNFILGLPGDRGISITAGRSSLVSGHLSKRTAPLDEIQPDDLAELAKGNDLGLEAAFKNLNP